MKKQNNKLGNPAVTTAIATYAANNPKEVKKAANIGLVITGVLILSVSGFAFYHLSWKHRFKKIKQNPNDRPANITESEAKLRADKIYRSMYGGGNGYKQVYEALRGLNRNGYILVYNAFGKRKPADDLLSFGNKKHMNLSEWFSDQFSGSELDKLRFLIDGGGTGLFGCSVCNNQ